MEKEHIQSNVAILSNLQLVCKNNIREDRQFLESIRDPEALEEVQKEVIQKHYGYEFTSLQELIYRKTSGHCLYADDGDYPVGIIKTAEEKSVSTCKCIKYTCSEFKKCRPGLSEEELENIRNLYQEVQLKEQQQEEARKRLEALSIIDEKPASPATSETHDTNAVPEPLQVTSTNSPDSNGIQGGTERKAAPATKETIEINRADAEMKSDENNPENPVPVTPKPAETAPDHTRVMLPFRVATQEEFIHLPAEESVIVNAGPGTGKTYALIQRLIHLVKNDEVAADGILVLCFTNAAVDVVKQRLKQVALENDMNKAYEEIEVRTFDSFATHVLYSVHDNEADYTLTGKNYEDRIHLFIDELKNDSGIMENCEYFVVDEIQDLVGVRAGMVLRILKSLPESCGFCLLGDQCQAIYDYSVDENSDEVSSSIFYSVLGKIYPDIQYLEFVENHRFSAARVESLKQLRQGLMEYDKEKIIGEIKKIAEQYPTIEVEATLLNQLKEKGTLALLTRTNAEALEISTQLYAMAITHSILLSSDYPSYAAWIGQVFSGYNGEVIDEESFLERFEQTVDSKEVTGEECWQALAETQDKENGPFYINDLLRGILQRGYDKIFFLDSRVENEPVVVSTVHRSKGKEYDTVCLSGKMLKDMWKSQSCEEGKVGYVALTRGRDRVCFIERKRNKSKIFIDKYTARSIAYVNQAERKKRRSKMGFIGFGLSGDINQTAFATREIQDAIHDHIITPGFGLELIREDKLQENQKPAYALWDTDGDFEFGIIPEKFTNDYSRLYRWYSDKLEYNAPLKITDFPETFTDLYVTAVTSCISTDVNKAAEASRFGDICVWNGLNVAGFMPIQLKDY